MSDIACLDQGDRDQGRTKLRRTGIVAYFLSCYVVRFEVVKYEVREIVAVGDVRSCNVSPVRADWVGSKRVALLLLQIV